MKAGTYKKRIIADMENIGTYKPEFNKVIDTLAQIYEDMDAAREQFRKSDGSVTTERVNKDGSVKMTKNPYFATIEGLQDRILKYNSELGLTPAGYKKLTGEGLKDERKAGGLLEALKKFEG